MANELREYEIELRKEGETKARKKIAMKMSQRSRDIQIKFRVSEEEAEQLRKKVEQSGKSMQEYLLGCALNKPITNTDGIKELYPEIKRIGNNLNQIAKALNGSTYYSYSLITQNQKELEKIWQLLKQYLQKQA